MAPLGESIARRRVFWFLVVLVVGPTIALAGYGLAGVKTQRDAAESRLHERYVLQSRELESGVLARLAEEDARLRRGLQDLSPEALDAAVGSLHAKGGVVREAWLATDPDVPPDVAGAAGLLSASSPVSFFTLSGGAETVAVSRVREGLVVAYGIDADVLDAVVVTELVGRLFPKERAVYHLRTVRAEPSGDAVSFDELRRDLAERIVESDPIVDRAMAPPFEHWRIVVEAPESGPPTDSRYLWIVGLLVAAVVSGVVLMGRAVVQQVRLSRLQTDFVSNISHELRTPLTSIRLFIETLQSGRVTDPDKVQECLDIIATESERLSRKIERVLSWARMEAGRRVYEFEVQRPIDIVGKALSAFRAYDLHGVANVEVAVAPDLPPVVADADALAEALLNLLGNARKYGGDDVKIKVSAVVDGKWVALSVSDDGPGIPITERRYVFEKFYRADSLLSRRTEGSGLGLSIVRAIATAHKGKVAVDSEGRGARFTIRLRRAG